MGLQLLGAMADNFRKVHRVIAVLFLLALPFAIYGTVTTKDPADPSPLTYFPVPFLFLLTITGTWLLVRPWIRKRRRGGAAEP